MVFRTHIETLHNVHPSLAKGVTEQQDTLLNLKKHRAIIRTAN